jgi:hypothetical protein
MHRTIFDKIINPILVHSGMARYDKFLSIEGFHEENVMGNGWRFSLRSRL